MELLRPILELGVVIPGIFACLLPGKIQFKAPAVKACFVACPVACAALCRRRRDVLCAPHANCADACRPNLACSRDLHKNAPDFALEIWNDCVVRLCGICLYQQPCKSAQRRYAGRFAGAGRTMVLSAGRDLLSCDLLAVCRHRLLSYDAQRAEDGRGRKFCTDLVCVLVLPLVFIALNLFMIPKYADTLYTGRVLQGYFVICIALLFLMLFFNAIFLLMAISINRNVRLQQENQPLSMQKQLRKPESRH